VRQNIATFLQLDARGHWIPAKGQCRGEGFPELPPALHNLFVSGKSYPFGGCDAAGDLPIRQNFFYRSLIATRSGITNPRQSTRSIITPCGCSIRYRPQPQISFWAVFRVDPKFVKMKCIYLQSHSITMYSGTDYHDRKEWR
jgi:hypothetical protein